MHFNRSKKKLFLQHHAVQAPQIICSFKGYFMKSYPKVILFLWFVKLCPNHFTHHVLGDCQRNWLQCCQIKGLKHWQRILEIEITTNFFTDSFTRKCSNLLKLFQELDALPSSPIMLRVIAEEMDGNVAKEQTNVEVALIIDDVANRKPKFLKNK